MTGSKFSSLRAMRERREQEASANPGPVMAPVEVAAAQTGSPRRVGRPPGKRSNPELICQGFGGASVRDGGLLLEGRR